MANYNNNLGQTRLGWRTPVVTNSPVQQTNTISASLLQSLYGVWNGDTTTNELGTSLYGVWNAEYSGTTSLETSLYGVWNGESLGTSLDTSIYRVYNGDNLNDTSGNSQNGTNVGGVTFTTGKVGNAFTFNGSNYVTLPNNSLNSLTGDFSISTWVNFATLGVTKDILSSFTLFGGNYFGFEFYQNGSGLIFGIYNGTTTISSLPSAGAPLSTNTWYNIVITRKASTGTKIYINGTLNNSNTLTQNPVYATTNYATIGGSNFNNSYVNLAASGTKIDGLTVWNKELTAGEITSLYNDGAGAEYPFSGQTLPSSNDAVGTNHGTLMNGCSFTTGKINKAFTFDGVNDIVRLPNNSLDLTGDFSISMWANWGRNNTSQILMSNFTIGASTRGWFIEHAAGQLRFRGFNSTGGNAFYIYTAYTPPLNTWVHYTFVHKNSSNKMYADGVLIGSDTGGSTHVAYDTPNYPMIGANQYDSTTYQEFFLGKLDAVSVWNRELSSNEVSMLYNGSNGTQYSSGSFGLTQSSLDSFGTNHGALVNATYGTGISGNAFQFNGTSAYVSFPTNSWNSLVGTDLTISLWVKFASTGNQTLISNMSAPGVNIWNGWEIRISSGQPIFYSWNNTGNTNGVIGSSVTTNTWYHIVATKRGNSYKIYMNGSLTSTGSGTGNAIVNASFYPNIGHLQYSSSFHANYTTNGTLIDAVNLWNREITADEVTQLYNSGTGAQYPFTGTFSSAINQLGMDNGTLMNGASLSTGKIGQAFTFDGVNDYVQLPDNSLNFTGDFSFSFWIYNDNMSLGVNRRYIGSSYYSGSGTYGFGWTLLRRPDNNYYFQLFNGDSNPNSLFSSNMDLITINEWTHIVVTRKRSTQTKIYKNGVDVTSNFSYTLGSNTIDCGYNSTQYCTIGALKDNNTSTFGYIKGKMDSVLVYQKELTQSEITELYNSGNGKQITATPIVQTGLVLNLDASRKSSYPNTGAIWYDISGNGKNGTLTNGPIFGTANEGSISFDGINDCIDFGDVLDMGTKSYTINMWIKLNSNSSIYQTFLSKALANQQNYRFAVGINNYNKLYAFLQGNTSGSDVTPSGTISLPLDTWFMATFIFDRSSSISIYYNGVNDVLTSSGVISQWSGLDFQSNNPFRIGSYTAADNSTPISMTSGLIGIAQVYDRVLSQVEITQNFNATKGRFGL